MNTDKLISVIVPCFNEEEVLPTTHSRLVKVMEALEFAFEIIYVDDGSRDGTREILKQLQVSDERVRVLRLSRNFGHQIAATAGLDAADGDAAVLIDADLQDPPEVIAEMVARWKEGYDVAYGQRSAREGETAFKLWTAKLFYRLFNRLSDTEVPLDTGDFRLMDRKVVEAIRQMREHDRFLRGIVSWMGFRQIAVPYRRAARAAGQSKYPLLKMVRFALDAIVSFSAVPLRLVLTMGLVGFGAAIVGMIWAIVAPLFVGVWISGWALLLIAVLFLSSVQLVCLGVIGEYVGRIYREAKRRPLYLLAQRLGFQDQQRIDAPAPVHTLPASGGNSVSRQPERSGQGSRAA